MLDSEANFSVSLSKTDGLRRHLQQWPAVAGLCAAPFTADAGLVQLSQMDNHAIAGGSNQLSADLTGDGLDDVSLNLARLGLRANSGSALVYIQGYRAIATFRSTSYAPMQIGFAPGKLGVVANSFGGPARNYATGTLTDPGINGGVATPFFVEFSAQGSIPGRVARFDIDRIVFDAPGQGSVGSYSFGASYDDYSAVPEPSAFGLAALASGAIALSRRRRRQAGLRTAR